MFLVSELVCSPAGEKAGRGDIENILSCIIGKRISKGEYPWQKQQRLLNRQ